MADVVCVHSTGEAKRALAGGDFDLVLLDGEPIKGIDVDPRFEFRDGKGRSVPVVTFSARPEISIGDARAPNAEHCSPCPMSEKLRQVVRYRLSKSARVSEEIV